MRTKAQGQGESGRLFLVDAMPLLYRSHFVFLKNPRVTSAGVNTSALFGYANSLLQILGNEKPTHMAVVFDAPGPTFRDEVYAEYKAGRQKMPEDILSAIPRAQDLAEALGIALLSVPGYEADDVIGTLATRASREGLQTFMVTTDKDFAQLVSENVRLHRPGSGNKPPEVLGVPEVLERWGIRRVGQFVDLLGLAGDATDNIPGVPGIGEKTAARLLGQFGSLDELLASTQQLKGKQKESLDKFAEQARLSRRLATITTDVPLEVGPADLALRTPDRERLGRLFREFEFKSLGERVLGKGIVTTPSLFPEESSNETAESGGVTPGEPVRPDLRRISEVPHEYRLARTPEERRELWEVLRQADSFCLDTETTGLDPLTGDLLGVAFCAGVHRAWYVPVPRRPEDSRGVLDELRVALEDPRAEKVGHNLKFDLKVLRQCGIRVAGRLFDTMLAHYVIDPEQRHGMDELARVYLTYDPIPISQLIGERGKEQRTLAEVAVETVGEYSAEDADVTLQLRDVLRPIVRERGAERALDECENPLIPALVDMEMEGIRIDTGALKEFSDVLAREMDTLRQSVLQEAGIEFNVDSPRQLGDILFERLKLEDAPQKTRTGQYATGESILTRLARTHRIAELVLEYRTCQKLKSTYVDTLPAAVSSQTGRIHTTYRQAVAATGRLQSHNPNLQNIPIRTERGKEIRRAFVPRGPGYALLSADYSQIELRIMAELSGDPGLRKAFDEGLDVHQSTAARVYGVPLEGVTPEMRRNAKMVNFGIMYGISPFGLADRLRISRGDAGRLIAQYFTQYPKVREYMDKTIGLARENGYVQTLLGRRRYLRDIQSSNGAVRGSAERNAINAPIQGTAADMIKLAMVAVYREFCRRGLRTKMLLQVHDELVFDLCLPEESEVRELVERCMRTALPMSVPIVVEMATGGNWLEAH